MDGIVVLVSKGIDTPEEFRVAYMPVVSDLYGPFDDVRKGWLPNSDAILDHFFECDVYTDGDYAFTYAETLAASLNRETEYGIALIRDYADIAFSDL